MNSTKRKDDYKSAMDRNSGNDYFNKANYFEALKCYNRSLCNAAEGSLNMSLAYANRSAIYMQIGETEKCLRNIELAKIHGYPNDKMEKLNDRKRKCLVEMAAQSKKDQQFVKISHEPNEKIPFIAACLQFREDKKYGRHIITDKDLKVGDVIALEPAFVACPRTPEIYARCYNCLKSNMMDLMPCQHCSEVMHCSEKCAEESKILHNFGNKIQGPHKGEYMSVLRIFNKVMKACNSSIVELKTIMEGNEKFSVFDFDLTSSDDPSFDKNRFRAFKSLMPEKTQRSSMEKLWAMFSKIYKQTFIEAWSIAEHYDFVQKLITDLFLIFSLNAHGMSWYSAPSSFMSSPCGDTPIRNSFGIGLFPFTSLISHSCAANCNTISADGDKLMVYVTLPVQAGEQIFISYGKSFTVTPYEQRQITLKEQYDFKCTCEACTNRYPVKLIKKNKKFRFPTRHLLDSVEAAREEFQKNNEYIQKYHSAHFPSSEIDDLTERNVYNVGCIVSDWMKFHK